MPDEITPFELPNPLPTDATELQALEAQAAEAFRARHAQGVATTEDMAGLQAMADKVKAVRGALSEAQASDAGEGEGEGEGGEPEGAPAPDPEAPAEPAAPEPAAPEGDDAGESTGGGNQPSAA